MSSVRRSRICRRGADPGGGRAQASPRRQAALGRSHALGREVTRLAPRVLADMDRKKAGRKLDIINMKIRRSDPRPVGALSSGTH